MFKREATRLYSFNFSKVFFKLHRNMGWQAQPCALDLCRLLMFQFAIFCY